MAIDSLWYTRCPVPTASGIAIQEGWLGREFASDAIEIRSLASSNDTKIRQSHYLLHGTHLIRHGGSSPVFNALAQGTDVRIVGIAQHEVSYPLLVAPDSTISTVNDFTGARVAIPRRTNDPVDFWQNTVLRVLDTALTAHGLSFSDLELVYLDDERTPLTGKTAVSARTGSLWGAEAATAHQRREVAALLRGEVDVIVSEGSYAATVIPVSGARIIFDTGRDLPSPHRANNDSPTVITADGELLDSNPDLVSRWLSTVLRAAEWAQNNEWDTKRLAALETGIAEEAIDTYFSARLHEQLDVDLSPERVAALQSFGDHLLKFNRIAQAVSVTEAIDSAPLDRAKALLAQASDSAQEAP